jgi:hypothetical protein
MALPHPVIQRTRTSLRQRPRKKKRAYQIFPASRTRSGWMFEDRHDDIGDLTNRSRMVSGTFPVLISGTNAAALGVTGSATKLSLRLLKMFAPTERSRVPASTVLILDPCSRLALVHRVPARSKPASLTCTPNFGSDIGRTAHAAPSTGVLQTPTQANGHKGALAPKAETSPGQRPRIAVDVHAPPPPSWSKSSAIAQCFVPLSHLDPALLDRVGSYEARLWRQAAQTMEP